MKTLKTITLCAVAAMIFASCSTKTANIPAGITKAQIDSASFYLGENMGLSIKMSDMDDLNTQEIIKGLKSILSRGEISQEEAQTIGQTGGMYLNDFFQKLSMAKATANTEKGAKFLEENGKKSGVITTESGLQYQIVRNGNGVKPTSVNDEVRVLYEGTTLDGKVFDSSYERGDTVSFALNQVIKGWGEGLQQIDEGGEIILWIPGDLAYGSRGAGGDIGPNETLKFRVELIEVKHIEPKTEENK